jgi:hypothetical protein
MFKQKEYGKIISPASAPCGIKTRIFGCKICEYHFCVGSRDYRLFNGFLAGVTKIIKHVNIQVLMNKD